jgi:peptidoglycan/LPS O-acetylase OafA/YrhL
MAKSISNGLSLYLDLLRFAAAVEVFIYHFVMLTNPFGWTPVWAAFGHEAVVVFFVLSGFVISYAAASLDRTASRFAISRLIRIYSVAVPALLLTVALDHWGSPCDPTIYRGFAPLHSPLLRFVISLLMVNEVWVSVQAFSNGPFWSVCYELTYYAIFGCFFYARGRTRTVLVTVCLLLTGPRTLLLFPIWVMGSLAYLETSSKAWSRVAHWVLFAAPLPALWFYMNWPLPDLTVRLAIYDLHWTTASMDLGHSRQALSDIFLGAAFTLHFVGAKHLGAPLERALRRIAAPVRILAGYTFTLYMVHLPVLLFVYATLSRSLSRPALNAAIIFAVVIVTTALGYVTEQQRHRLRAVVTRLLSPQSRTAMPIPP